MFNYLVSFSTKIIFPDSIFPTAINSVTINTVS